jgi:hypothetical protein
MKKMMSVDEYRKLTDSDKSEIERLMFETLKEEIEKLFPFLKIERIDLSDYWEKVDEEATRWKELSGFVLSNGKTYVRLPEHRMMTPEQYGASYSEPIYQTIENIFEFFKLPNSVLGVTLAWGDEDYF